MKKIQLSIADFEDGGGGGTLSQEIWEVSRSSPDKNADLPTPRL